MNENAVLMIGLTDQPYYSICHFMVRLFIHTVGGLSLYFGPMDGQTTIRLPDDGQTASTKYWEIDWNLRGPTIEDLPRARAKTCAHAFPFGPGHRGSESAESYQGPPPPQLHPSHLHGTHQPQTQDHETPGAQENVI